MSRVVLTGSLICSNESEAAIVASALPEHVELTRSEPGCLSFVVERTADPLVWRVAERFVDHAAFEAHQARVAESEWGRATMGIKRDYSITTEPWG